MKKAILKRSFSIVQWHGEHYLSYEEDAEYNKFNEGEEVLVVHDAGSNPMGKLYVVFNERIQESAVISETFLEFEE